MGEESGEILKLGQEKITQNSFMFSAVMLAVSFFIPFFISSVKAEEASRLEKPIEEKEIVFEISEEEIKRIEEAARVDITQRFWDRVFLICDLDALGLYSKIGGEGSVSGADVNLKLSPAIMLGPKDFLIPLYNGSYSRTKQAVKEVEGTRLHESFQDHNVNFAWRHRFSEEFTTKINVFGTWSYSVETKDEDWGDGLYDYEDLGVDLDLRRVERAADLETKKYTASFEFYRRKYPNYGSLISLASVTAPEEYEKDYRGYRLTGGYEFARTNDWSLGIDYGFLFKDFRDKKVIDADGILTDDERDDYVHNADINYSYKINENWILGIDNNYEIYDSNQNFYDSRATIPLNDDVYTDSYYDYFSIALRPGITYLRQIAPERTLVVNLLYGFTYKKYDERKKQDSNGVYSADRQVDKIFNVALNIKYPLNKNWALLFLAEYMDVDSNMDYERYYFYDYELYNVGAGLSYSF